MEQSPHAAPPPDLGAGELEIDLRAIFGTLWRRRWVLGGCVLLITSIAILVAFQLTPRYTATTEVLIDPRESKVADVEAVLSGLSSDASTIESQIQVLKSRSLATRVVNQLKLAQNPEFNAALREPGAIGSTLGWIRSLLPAEPIEESEEQRRERELSRMVDVLLGDLAISQVGATLFCHRDLFHV